MCSAGRDNHNMTSGSKYKSKGISWKMYLNNFK